jgi:hypothetical protein
MSIEEAPKILLWVTVVMFMLYPLYFYWKIYGVYRALGNRTKELGFFWFSFQFQHPVVSRGMKSYLNYYDALPDDLKARVDAVRRQLRSHVASLGVWILFVVAFAFLVSYLKRNNP